MAFVLTNDRVPSEEETKSICYDALRGLVGYLTGDGTVEDHLEVNAGLIEGDDRMALDFVALTDVGETVVMLFSGAFDKGYAQ